MSEVERSRRELLLGAGAAAGAAALGGVLPADAAARLARPAPHPKTPQEALRVLMRGNRRYRRGRLELRDYTPIGEDIANSQKPFAAIITCADSRLSPTIVFDVSRGNIFVSRVAGNSIDTGTLGSTEYAVKVLGVRLIMVLGHSDCGAVKAAIGVANGTSSYPPDKYGKIGAFVDEVVPAVESVSPAQRSLRRCIRVNARFQAEEIAATDPIVKPAVESGKVGVVAAEYVIDTGKVRLL